MTLNFIKLSLFSSLLLSHSLAFAEQIVISPIDTPDVPIISVLLVKPIEIAGQTASQCQTLLASSLDPNVTAVIGVSEDLKQEVAFEQLLKAEPINEFIVQDIRILIEPQKTKHYGFQIIELPQDEWLAEPSEQTLAPYLEQFPIAGHCSVTSEVSYYSTDLNISAPAPFIDWQSEEASLNQLSYDTEFFEFFKVLYGDRGLSYGDHTKGGLYLNMQPVVPGAQWSYNQFSLLWSIQEPDIEQLTEGLFPPSILALARTDWSNSCHPISMKFSVYPDFTDAISQLINDPQNCAEYPIFNHDGFIDFPMELTDTTKITYLNDVPRLHFITYKTDELNQKIACDSRDTLSMQGCSQPIVRDLEASLIKLMLQQTDLYVEIDFNNFVRKTIHINSVTGELTEINSVSTSK